MDHTSAAAQAQIAIGEHQVIRAAQEYIFTTTEPQIDRVYPEMSLSEQCHVLLLLCSTIPVVFTELSG